MGESPKFVDLDNRYFETVIRILKDEYKTLQRAFGYVSRERHPDIYISIDKRLSEIDVSVMRIRRLIKEKM